MMLKHYPLAIYKWSVKGRLSMNHIRFVEVKADTRQQANKLAIDESDMSIWDCLELVEVRPNPEYDAFMLGISESSRGLTHCVSYDEEKLQAAYHHGFEFGRKYEATQI
jgi:hypothetical protein